MTSDRNEHEQQQEGEPEHEDEDEHGGGFIVLLKSMAWPARARGANRHAGDAPDRRRDDAVARAEGAEPRASRSRAHERDGDGAAWGRRDVHQDRLVHLAGRQPAVLESRRYPRDLAGVVTFDALMTTASGRHRRGTPAQALVRNDHRDMGWMPCRSALTGLEVKRGDRQRYQQAPEAQPQRIGRPDDCRRPGSRTPTRPASHGVVAIPGTVRARRGRRGSRGRREAR